MNHNELIKKIANEHNVGEHIAELVVKDSFKNVSRVLSNTDISEVEIPVIGKIRMSEVKLRKRLDKYYTIREIYEEKISSYLSSRDAMSGLEFRKYEKKLKSLNNDIANLEKKYLRMNNNKN